MRSAIVLHRHLAIDDEGSKLPFLGVFSCAQGKPVQNVVDGGVEGHSKRTIFESDDLTKCACGWILDVISG